MRNQVWNLNFSGKVPSDRTVNKHQEIPDDSEDEPGDEEGRREAEQNQQ